MADHEKVTKITRSLSELFPELANEFEKEKWYYDHSYCTFSDWEKAVEKIIDSVA
jgi:hypothetical protein